MSLSNIYSGTVVFQRGRLWAFRCSAVDYTYVAAPLCKIQSRLNRVKIKRHCKDIHVRTELTSKFWSKNIREPHGYRDFREGGGSLVITFQQYCSVLTDHWDSIAGRENAVDNNLIDRHGQQNCHSCK